VEGFGGGVGAAIFAEAVLEEVAGEVVLVWSSIECNKSLCLVVSHFFCKRFFFREFEVLLGGRTYSSQALFPSCVPACPICKCRICSGMISRDSF